MSLDLFFLSFLFITIAFLTISKLFLICYQTPIRTGQRRNQTKHNKHKITLILKMTEEDVGASYSVQGMSMEDQRGN